jgi:hypothetical protein
MTQEGLQALRAFRGRLNEQLMHVPEYRAIAVIDRTIQEISEIYDAAKPEASRPAAAPAKDLTGPNLRPVADAMPISDAAQSRIAMAIAEAIETNVSQLRTQRMPAAAPYALVGAAS